MAAEAASSASSPTLLSAVFLSFFLFPLFVDVGGGGGHASVQRAFFLT